MVAAALIASLLAGCGGGSETGTSGAESTQADLTTAAEKRVQAPEDRELWVAMDGWDGAETIGLVMAESRGYFEKEKLFVTALSPVSASLSIPDVINHTDDVAIAHGPQVVIARSKGAPIAIVGSMVPHPTAALIWTKESGIGGIADLKGKTIAIPGLAFQRDFLEVALSQEGLTVDDVKVKNVGNDLVPSLVKGKADAIFGGSANLEGVDIESQGLEPVVTPVRALGIPDYEELVLVAREDRMEEDPEPVRDLAAAITRGAAKAAAEPRRAALALDDDGESNPELSPRTFRVATKRSVPLLSGNGEVDAQRTEALIDWMYEEEMIERKPSLDELLYAP
ncbi:MAG TPA: ABC transporter substrate-binding protein [Solirubrobacterales bacterium]